MISVEGLSKRFGELRAVERISALPGVESASVSTGLHLCAGLVFNGVLATESATQDRRRLKPLLQD